MSGYAAAVTGVGAVTPLGVGADTLFERWRKGETGLHDGRGVCDEFDVGSMLTRKQARRTDRFVQLGLMAADEAVGAAWGSELAYAPDRVACILGVSLGGAQVLFDQYEALREGGPGSVWPLTIPITMPNASPAVFAMRFGFHGESRSVASACASSAQAIGESLRTLQLGEADAVITGGSESCLTDFVLAAFSAAGALSRSGECRPFDERRDGFVMAEGAGVLVLEDPEKAEARGADILGYVTGYAGSTDGHHLTAPADDGEVCAAAITSALASAGRRPADVDYVSAHATSTPANDRAETAALKLALGDHAYRIPVSAPKSVVGHSIGAAGAVEAIAALLTLRSETVPPTVGLERPEPGLDLNYVPGEAIPLPPREDGSEANRRRVAVSNAFAFGGHNSVLVLEA